MRTSSRIFFGRKVVRVALTVETLVVPADDGQDRREWCHVLEQLFAKKRMPLDRLTLVWQELTRLVHDRRRQLGVADIAQQRPEADRADRDLIQAKHFGDLHGARCNTLAVAHHQAVVRLERGRECDQRVRGGAHVPHETHLTDEELRVP